MTEEQSKKGKASRLKGHNFERELVRILKEALGSKYEITRGLQYQNRQGSAKPADVQISYEGKPLIHIEAKKGKAPNIHKAYLQAYADRGLQTIPVAITKRDYEEALATMSLETFIELLQEYTEHREILLPDRPQYVMSDLTETVADNKEGNN